MHWTQLNNSLNFSMFPFLACSQYFLINSQVEPTSTCLLYKISIKRLSPGQSSAICLPAFKKRYVSTMFLPALDPALLKPIRVDWCLTWARPRNERSSLSKELRSQGISGSNKRKQSQLINCHSNIYATCKLFARCCHESLAVVTSNK